MNGEHSIEALRLNLAPAVARAAVFDGWTDQAVRAAAEELDLDPDAAVYAFSGDAMAMIGSWVKVVDLAMAKDWPADRLQPLKIRDRIRTLVLFRLESIAHDREALRRALAVMAMPQNLVSAARLGWQSADAMWRLAGDTSADYNHYTKRMILGSIYAACLAVFVDDDSPEHADTKAFLERRIDGIMKFEKAKARLLDPEREHFSPVRVLGRLRYPAR